MTNKQSIHEEIDREMSKLRQGDYTELDRLEQIISVGDIKGSTAVAIGSNIHMIVDQRQYFWPENIIRRLLAILNKVEGKIPTTSSRVGLVRLFIAAPGDVADEWGLTEHAVEKIKKDPPYSNLNIHHITWNRRSDRSSTLSFLTPDEAQMSGFLKPSDCDIVAIILRSQLGTKLSSISDKIYSKEANSLDHDQTVLEWIFRDAIKANKRPGWPQILVYYCSNVPSIPLDAPDIDERKEQYSRVNKFLNSIRNAYPKPAEIVPYTVPTEFEGLFGDDLRRLIWTISEDADDSSVQSMPYSPSEMWPIDKSPYPGLRAYNEEYAQVFFGRGRETDALIAKLAHPSCRLITVIGASGSGKSSLVTAGLLPRLRDDAVEGSQAWEILSLTPNQAGAEDPFISLAKTLTETWSELSVLELAQQLEAKPSALRDMIESRVGQAPAWVKVFLFIDQFEELFTQNNKQNKHKQQSFIAALVDLVSSDRVRIVLTLRSDYYGEFIRFSALADLLRREGNETFPLDAPSSFALYKMIVGPAKLANLELEDELVFRILSDLSSEPGVLASMAYTLAELYERCKVERRLSLDMYVKLGGISEALNKRAEQEYLVLQGSDSEKMLALHQVFSHLTAVNETGAVRRRMQRRYFENNEDALNLIEAFTKAHLLVQYSSNDDIFVEVAHDALLRSWNRIADWIVARQSHIRLLGEMREAARKWNESGQSRDYLWLGNRNIDIQTMLQYLNPPLNDIEQLFSRPEQVHLLDEINEINTSHLRRSEISLRLHQIGDHRSGVGLHQDGLPDINWCFVEGISPNKNIKISNQEFTVESFFIAKYPITYCQFQSFLDDKEHGLNDDWWWVGFDKKFKRWPLEARRPYDNYPRDMVTWFHAVAFTRWLDRLLPKDRWPVDDFEKWQIRLPTEWEWQHAANEGSRDDPYPWGEWNKKYCNTTESGIEHAVAVGMYPHGTAACGALDMSGNMWEWCLNEYEQPASTGFESNNERVNRGGSFRNNKLMATVDFRGHDNPNQSRNRFCFRIICGIRLYD